MEWRSKKEITALEKSQRLVRLMLLFYLGLLWRKETTSHPDYDLLHENVAEMRISRELLYLSDV